MMKNHPYRIYRRTLTDALYFYHADHLGTPIAMTNSTGTLVWRAEHTPFGGVYALTVGTISNNLRFPGQYFDGETGLAQNWFRDFSKNTGRYCQSDPLVSLLIMNDHFNQITWPPGLLQGYAFAGSNPITGFDFTGLLTKLCHRRFNLPIPIKIGPFHHDFLWVNGHTYSFNENSQVVVDDPLDHEHEGDCHTVKCIDDAKLMKNIKNATEHPYSYSLYGFNCQDWAATMLNLSPKKGCCKNKGKP